HGAGNALPLGWRRRQRLADLRCRRARAAGLCRAAGVRVLDAIFLKLFHKVWRESTKCRLFSKLSFPLGAQRFLSPIMANFERWRSEGHDREGRHGGGWSLRMLWGARGRRARARAAQLAAFAVSAAVALWAASLAAEPAASGRQTEPAASGRQTEPAANGRQTEPAANGRQAEPAPNGRLVGNGAGAGTMDQALIQSYQNNPQLNSQRSATRAIDENVPTALAGYRPRVSGTAS